MWFTSLTATNSFSIWETEMLQTGLGQKLFSIKINLYLSFTTETYAGTFITRWTFAPATAFRMYFEKVRMVVFRSFMANPFVKDCPVSLGAMIAGNTAATPFPPRWHPFFSAVPLATQAQDILKDNKLRGKKGGRTKKPKRQFVCKYCGRFVAVPVRCVGYLTLSTIYRFHWSFLVRVCCEIMVSQVLVAEASFQQFIANSMIVKKSLQN